MKSFILIVSFLAFLITDHTGTYVYSIQGPDGATYEGALVIELDGGDYKGEIQSEVGNAKLQDLEIDGDDITFNLDYSGYTLQYEGTFDGDELNAIISIEGFEIPFKATKKVE